MLADYWLLSDLDGTLISTPHKAQGQYLPITRSPCYDPIRRWLMNGGNVCIVTTADQRVIEQVYLPLRQCLAESESRCEEYYRRLMRKAHTTSATGNHTSSGSVSTQRQPTGGRLLLSLYTGAVLYLCTSRSITLLPGYATAWHCATREAVELTRAFGVTLPIAPLVQDPVSGDGSGDTTTTVSCVRGTCIHREASNQLQTRVKVIYERYLNDILYGEPTVVAALKLMSTRYKKMWRALLTFLEHMYLSHTRQTSAIRPPACGNDFNILYSGSAQTAESRQWKAAFFARCDGLLAALGILRVEYVEAEVTFDDYAADYVSLPLAVGSATASCSSAIGVAHSSCVSPQIQRATKAARVVAQRRREQELADQKLIVEHAARVILASTSQTMEAELRPLVTSFAVYMTGLLGVDPRDLKKRLTQTPATYDDVAQVIVLGLPLTLFSRYFAEAVRDFIRCGVQAVPQPNSVVFSKTGVSKSTTLRYLLGKDRIASEQAGRSASDSSHGHDCSSSSLATFAACVDAAHALAFGDNPHTTDYELTVFPDVAFVSVERQGQREERHRRIQRRLQRTRELEARGEVPRLPSGAPAPSSAQLEAAVHRSGPMLDDRLLRNLSYIGGEEEGTAVLLATLMDRLQVPPLTRSRGHCREDAEALVPVASFQRTLPAVEASARRKVAALMNRSHL